MAKTERNYVVGAGTRKAIARVLMLLQENLDDEWTLEAMARRAGYARHHFAHAFEAIVGTAPLEHLRVLRLHRAAHRLATQHDVDVLKIGLEAGYASLKAFRRAFAREFGRAPSVFAKEHRETHAMEREQETRMRSPAPPGLVGRPTIVFAGPFSGVSLRAPALDQKSMMDTLAQFLALARPRGAWTVGTVSPAFGWSGGAARREFRCIHLVETARLPEPPLEPWSFGVHRFARFEYEGPTAAIRDAYPWIFDAWMRTSRWRYAFAPVITLYDDDVWYASGFLQSRARIFTPIERI